MSYAIVTSIKIKDGKVLLKSADNNVYPHYYHEWECQEWSSLLKEKGQEAVDIEILKDYENGNMQAGNSNKYTRALKVLLHFEEYKEYDWRNNYKYQSKEWEEVENNRKSDAFNKLLKRALNTYLPKDKFIVSKIDAISKVYVLKITKRFIKWTGQEIKAKIFRYREDAEKVKSYCSNTDNWIVERI